MHGHVEEEGNWTNWAFDIQGFTSSVQYTVMPGLSSLLTACAKGSEGLRGSVSKGAHHVCKHKDLGLILRTMWETTTTTTTGVVAHSCNPSSREVETGRFRGLTVPHTAYLIGHRPVRNPVSQSKEDGACA